MLITNLMLLIKGDSFMKRRIGFIVALVFLSIFFLVSCKPTNEIKKYSVIFKDHDNSVLLEVKVDEGRDATPPADPSRTGYTFSAWDGSYTNIKEDTVITALYEINQYTYIFYDEDGETVLRTLTVDYGSVITPPTNPIKTSTLEYSYAFDKWTPSIPDSITSDISFVASYNRILIEYTITFDTTGGSIVEPLVIANGSDIVVEDIPTKEGFIFIGWEGLPEVMPTNDIEVIALWREVTDNTFEYNESFDELDEQEYTDFEIEGLDEAVFAFNNAKTTNGITIDDVGIILKNEIDSYIEITFSNGVEQFYFEYRKASSDLSLRVLEVSVDGDVIESTVAFGLDNNIYNLLVEINESNTVVVRVSVVSDALTDSEIVIDNIKWNSYESTISEQLALAKDNLEIIYSEGDDVNSITDDITLPIVGLHGVSVSWSINLDDIISSSGAVSRTEEDTVVTLTATLTLNGFTETKVFVVTVKAFEFIKEYFTVNLTYPNGAGTTNMGDSNNAEIVGLDDEIFAVESVQRNVSPIHIGLNNAGQMRLYGSTDTNGNILKVSINSNFEITEIKITFGTVVGDAIIEIDEVTEFSGTLSSNAVMIFTDLEAGNFSIQNKNSSTGQIYILSIEITYTPVNIDPTKPIFRASEEDIYYHTIDDLFTPPQFDAYDHYGKVATSVLSHNVEEDTLGTYTVTYQATNALGTTYFNLTVIVREKPEISDYYNPITASPDNPELFFQQLRALVSIVTAGNGHQNTSYEEVKMVLVQSDFDPRNPGYLRGMYDQALINPVWDNGSTWNREHVWPQSLLPDQASASKRNVASDSHNLRAIKPATNTSRGNKYFDLITTAQSYYPSDADKGDAARILLYMVLRYDNLSLDTKSSALTMGNILILNDWHSEDGVDDLERNRNDVIELYQGNRNPFIDNPEWFSIVWNYLIDIQGLRGQVTSTIDPLDYYMMVMSLYDPEEDKRYFIN